MITFGATTETAGAHEHVRVFAGAPGARGLCGTLVMRPEEAKALLAILIELPPAIGDVIESMTSIAAVEGRETSTPSERVDALIDCLDDAEMSVVMPYAPIYRARRIDVAARALLAIEAFDRDAAASGERR